MDFAYQWLLKTRKSESDLSKSVSCLLQLMQEGMVSRSPNLYLLMVQLVHNFSSRANLNSIDKRLRNNFVDNIYKLVDNCLKIARDHSTTIVKNQSGSGHLDDKIVSQIKSLSLKVSFILLQKFRYLSVITMK